ncbi:MAG TPA: SBBP repeat-containing protein [Terriglobia bacterium]|nr:SBBP repeat-containing protein [Terriglobia bacterium]
MPAALDRSGIVRAYARLPLAFEPNRGQAGSQVKFLARGQGYTLYLTAGGAVLALDDAEANPERRSAAAGNPPQSSPTPGAWLRLRLLGANPQAKLSGAQELAGKSNYLIGNDPSKWHVDLPNYRRVFYAQPYRRINLVFYGRQGRLEYDFNLQPGSDPRQIRLGLEAVTSGAALGRLNSSRVSKMRIAANGDLVVGLPGGDVRFEKPVAYQEAGSRRQTVQARFALGAKGTVGFALGRYDHTRPLVIDPVLVYSTFLGGTGADTAAGVAVDSLGYAYIAGSTQSANFPVTRIPVPVQSKLAGATNAFISKLNPTGSALVYSTYLGGVGVDQGAAIAVDSGAQAYLAGTTSSADFPTTKGALQTTYGGNGDAFVAVLSVNGSSLSYSTYLGGSGADAAHGIALDSSNDAYVAGSTQSSDFPTMGAAQAALAGTTNAFVSKLSPNGSALMYSTFLGGSATDSAQSIALDSSGAAYVAGFTLSADFPTLNAFQKSYGGNGDAFVAKLNAAGSALAYSTYLGGAALDRGFGLAVDASGNAYITGDSSSADFPVTAGSFQSLNAGNDDAFVAKLDAAGSALAYSTFLGGSGADQGYAIAVDGGGNAVVTGLTESADFPLQAAYQPASGGGSCGAVTCSDAFVTRLDSSGATLLLSSYLGGSGADFGLAVALDSAGNAYVAGVTSSANFPAVGNAFQGTYGGAGLLSEGFVTKVSSADAPALTATPQVYNFGNQGEGVASAPLAITLGNSGTAPLTLNALTPSAGYVVLPTGSTCTAGTVLQTAETCIVNVAFEPTVLGPQDGTLAISDNASGSPHLVALNGSGVTPTSTGLTLSATTLTFSTPVVVGQASASQSITVTNSGSAAATFTSILVTANYSASNNCGTSLNPGASCTVKVVFAPLKTGAITGTLTLTDTAPNSPQTVSLSGTGLAVFSVAATQAAGVVAIGATSVTYTVTASGPKGFNTQITLGCSSSATCTFSVATIAPGQTSTLTLSGLTGTTANPFSFSVTGTIDASSVTTEQIATTPVTLTFADFYLTESPALTEILAGQSATYSMSVMPLNGFNKPISLGCVTLDYPAYATCSVSPSSVTLDGKNPASATVTVTTMAQSARAVPRSRPGGPTAPPPLRPALWTVLAGLGLLALQAGLRSPRGARASRLALLGGALALVALWSACQTYGYNVIGTGGLGGTPSGSYVITVQGAIGGTSSTSGGCTTTTSSSSTTSCVVRTATANLTVQSNVLH